MLASPVDGSGPGAGRIAIFAGRGALPRLLSERYPDALVVKFKAVGIDFSPAHVLEAEFERLGALFRDLKAGGVSEICFAGAVRRPKLRYWRLDLWTLRALFHIRQILRKKDGSALIIVRKLVEREGFRVLGAHELCPDLLAVAGPLGSPSPKAPPDLEFAKCAHGEMSRQDQGQALVIRDGVVIAREGRAGTSFMLASITPAEPASGYLFKSSKEGQDLDMDMASIGPDTVDEVVRAGLGGIIIGAGRSLILEREEVIRRADEAGIYILGIVE